MSRISGHPSCLEDWIQKHKEEWNSILRQFSEPDFVPENWSLPLRTISEVYTKFTGSLALSEHPWIMDKMLWDQNDVTPSFITNKLWIGSKCLRFCYFQFLHSKNMNDILPQFLGSLRTFQGPPHWPMTNYSQQAMPTGCKKQGGVWAARMETGFSHSHQGNLLIRLGT